MSSETSTNKFLMWDFLREDVKAYGKAREIYPRISLSSIDNTRGFSKLL